MALNTEYLKSAQGILKILEFITICIVLSCLFYFDFKLGILSGIFPVRFYFSIVVFLIGWLVVLSLFLLFLFSLTEKNVKLALKGRSPAITVKGHSQIQRALRTFVIVFVGWELLAVIEAFTPLVTLQLLVISVLLALLFLIASALMADFLRDAHEEKWLKNPTLSKFSDILTVSMIFGFVSIFFLAVDGFLFYKIIKTETHKAREQAGISQT